MTSPPVQPHRAVPLPPDTGGATHDVVDSGGGHVAGEAVLPRKMATARWLVIFPLAMVGLLSQLPPSQH